ncbi:histidine kinase [Methylorubrum zatmanii]|uniref:Histidine kinase n=1 Tax=Methylorubrum zatmanii TaxID=29429 RepID=A0ABW1WU49_9HYPH|nr:histidine kinase [Methylorubrum zatmanii]MBD8906131.1 histidine kinase [Methylorubrum zatmanii]
MMQRKQDREEVTFDRGRACASEDLGSAVVARSCYGVQVLIAGRRKQWRDEINGQLRRAGYSATSVDSAVDALTVLVLGLPIDVLVTDAELHGSLGFDQLAAEARALRPNLGIVVACDAAIGDCADLVPPDALMVPYPGSEEAVATTVREALAARAA